MLFNYLPIAVAICPVVLDGTNTTFPNGIPIPVPMSPTFWVIKYFHIGSSSSSSLHDDKPI